MLNPASNPHPFRSVFSNDFCEVIESTVSGSKSLHALKEFQAGELISPFGASYVSKKPSYLTVQVGIKKHITLLPQYLQYINHSCQPNVFFNTTTMELTALKPIQPGDEFTFFYPSTEWDMAQPFQCLCNQPGCLGMINGASSIPKEILSRYAVTDFIQEMISTQ